MKKIVSILLVGFFYVQSYEHEEFVEQLVEKKDQISIENPFVFFDMMLSAQEKKVIEGLSILKTETLRLYAFQDDNYKRSEIFSFVQSHGNNAEQSEVITSIFHRLILDFLQICNLQAARVLVQFFVPDTTYDYPYWHIDGAYYNHDYPLQYKCVATLKGPGTLFCTFTDDAIKQKFAQQFYHRTDNKPTVLTMVEQEQLYRKKLAEIIVGCPMQQYDKYQGALFLVGGSFDKAACHAVPVIDDHRILITIVPGTENQIQYCQSRNY